MAEWRNALECRGITVGYGGAPVLTDVDLTVAAGEAVSVLGPSGSGKTTLLYTVAGFIQPAAGRVVVGGVEVAGPNGSLPPERRRVGFVFQNYALWPHLDARDTVAFPLRRAGMRRQEAQAEAMRLLELMGIAPLARRRPAELSGGEQQRVGVARALARKAEIYLFDEPTAHLDMSRRAALQEEIVRRRREQGAAALYCTHDAGEALALADRVALLREGQFVQLGTPGDVYERPVDVWSARLTGPASLLEARVVTVGEGDAIVDLGGSRARPAIAAVGELRPGPTWLMVRPDWAKFGGDLPATLESAWYRGTHTDYLLLTPTGRVEVRASGPPAAAAGDRVGWTLLRAWVPGGVEPAGGVVR